MIFRDDIVEIMDAVDELNEIITDQDPDTSILFTISYCGFAASVDFGEIQIWNSENDDNRKYDEDTDTYEPYKDCFIRSVVLAIDSYIKIKLF